LTKSVSWRRRGRLSLIKRRHRCELRAALEELRTCIREFSGPLLDGELSADDHKRFSRALVQLQLQFPKSPEII
jgi:hypothetical protein